MTFFHSSSGTVSGRLTPRTPENKVAKPRYGFGVGCLLSRTHTHLQLVMGSDESWRDAVMLAGLVPGPPEAAVPASALPSSMAG